MGFRKVFDYAERYLARIHLVCWIVEGLVSISSAMLSALWAHASGFPWPLIALTAFGGFAAATATLVLLYGLWTWLLDVIPRLSNSRGICIVLGSGAPFETYTAGLHKRYHLIKIGLRNNSQSHALTNCEVILKSISGRFSNNCPISVKSGFILNPGSELYCEFVGMDESGMEAAYDRDVQKYGIRAYFPINPLPSDHSSWLDDQPYTLRLIATAAESPPYSLECHLFVEKGVLKLEGV